MSVFNAFSVVEPRRAKARLLGAKIVKGPENNGGRVVVAAVFIVQTYHMCESTFKSNIYIIGNNE